MGGHLIFGFMCGQFRGRLRMDPLLKKLERVTNQMPEINAALCFLMTAGTCLIINHDK